MQIHTIELSIVFLIWKKESEENTNARTKQCNTCPADKAGEANYTQKITGVRYEDGAVYSQSGFRSGG